MKRDSYDIDAIKGMEMEREITEWANSLPPPIENIHNLLKEAQLQLMSLVNCFEGYQYERINKAISTLEMANRLLYEKENNDEEDTDII